MEITPNWQHHSKKEQKRHLKPQALRAARERRKHLINKLVIEDVTHSPKDWEDFWYNEDK